MTAEGVDIDLYADDIEQDFNADEFAAEGVDLYDDVITTTSGRRDSEGGEPQVADNRPCTPSNIGTSPVSSKSNSAGSNHDHVRDREYIQPLRKHQVYIGNLTWWTSDRDIQEALNEMGVHDFVEVKFYENRANGQSKGYCVLTVGSDSSLKIIKDKFGKKEIHGQMPVVTPPTKQALNQFEAQSKTRPTPGPGGSGGGGSGGNMNMNNMMSGPRGPMGPMGPQMGMGGYGPRMMMGSPIRGPRGMGPGLGPPPPGHRNLGPPNHQNSPGGGGGQFSPPQRPMGGPHNSLPPPPGPVQRPPPGMPMFQGQGPVGPQGMGGPPRGPMPHNMMERGPPPRQDWSRPPINAYPPHGQAPIPPPGPLPGPIRGPQAVMSGPPPPQGAPAPHMNPAFFNQGPTGPPQGPPPTYNTSPRPTPGTQYPPPVEHHETPAMSEAEFEEVMGRNRTVSRSAISRAVTDAASGEYASAIETLVTAISLIKQSKVAPDDRCKILISSLQDTLHGIEAKSYGRSRERSRSRERDRHRRSRRERSRSRERDYRDRSRERYYEYPRERSRSRDREYRERNREESSSSRYYEDRYRDRDRERERERPRVEPDRSREREREREPEREAVHRAPRH